MFALLLIMAHCLRRRHQVMHDVNFEDLFDTFPQITTLTIYCDVPNEWMVDILKYQNQKLKNFNLYLRNDHRAELDKWNYDHFITFLKVCRHSSF
uniref:Uncharacterized protein n=1 Tax=Panagrellus redivivus TaxID=6233 RepID=A0A7E4ZYF7_PANRE